MAKNKRTTDPDTGVMQIRLPTSVRAEVRFAAQSSGKKTSDWVSETVSKAARAAIIEYANAQQS